MDCKSCGIEIPPVWVAALKSNICPSCGGEIMNSELQELITGLSGAMDKMPGNPQGIACWLVSNYKLSKINSYEPPEFKKQQPQQQAQPQNKQVKQNSFPANLNKQTDVEDFFLRANVNLANLKGKKTASVPSPIKQIEEEEDFPDEPVVEMDEVDKMMVVPPSNAPISEDEKDSIAAMVENAKYGAEGSPYFQEVIAKQQATANSGRIRRSG